MRKVVALALRSHIPIDTWLSGPPADLETALELLTELDSDSSDDRGG
jgi:hypothetical protein